MHLELGGKEPCETKELADNLYVDFNDNGQVVALTIEHARGMGASSDFSYHVIGSERGTQSVCGVSPVTD